MMVGAPREEIADLRRLLVAQEFRRRLGSFTIASMRVRIVAQSSQAARTSARMCAMPSPAASLCRIDLAVDLDVDERLGLALPARRPERLERPSGSRWVTTQRMVEEVGV
jgi:hypothetical protein